MFRSKFSIWIILALILAACGTGPPQVTPTVAPTSTPNLTRIAELATRTPIVRLSDTPTLTMTILPTLIPSLTPTGTLTPTNTPTATATFTMTASPTVTASPTLTLTTSLTPTGTLTPTNTPSATPTLTHTPTPTATFTIMPSNTPTLTPIPSNTIPPSPTPLPLIDTATATIPPTFTPTFTPPPSVTPTLTFTPTNTFTPTATFTNTPNLVATENAERLQTRAAISDTPARSTFTPVRQSSPTSTLIPPTLDATPTFVTATANSGIIPTLEIEISVTLPPPVQIDFNVPPATSTTPPLTPSPFPQEQIPPTVQVQSRENIVVDAPVFSNSSTNALIFNVGSGNFVFNGEALSGDVRLFVVNPADPSSYAKTDNTGFLIFRPIGGGEGTVVTSPFTTGFTVNSAETNKNYISDLAWSPDGQRLAFIIQPAAGTDNVNAGVWFWDAGSNNSYVLLHDCPHDGYNSCALTNHPTSHWQSMDVEWSPNSNNVIITAWLPDEGRQAIFIAPMNFASSRPQAPLFERWENGQWLNDSQILVSGRAPDGRSLIAIYNTIINGIEVDIFDASANGLYIFDAVQRSDRQIFALGREEGSAGALRLYRITNGVATPLSGYIGEQMPQRVQWSANYSEAVLIINGQQFTVSTNTGAIWRPAISGSVQVGGNVSNSGQLQAPPPSGVVVNSRYSAGQQIQYIGDTPRNMRVQPSIAAARIDVVNLGEFVTILAGPYEADGYEWWQISNARNNRAWISTRSTSGFSFFSP